MRLEFQSSPSPKTGRYSDNRLVKRIGYLFQSSPSPKTGRYLIKTMRHNIRLMFQSSPSPKTGRYPKRLLNGYSDYGVPILTQSENWALFAIEIVAVQKLVFQSSPSPKTGRYAKQRSPKLRASTFQSSPSPKTGRYNP